MAVEMEWHEPKSVATTEIGDRIKEIDFSVAAINRTFKEIDACTDKESLQAILDRIRNERVVIDKADEVFVMYRDRIMSRAELI